MAYKVEYGQSFVAQNSNSDVKSALCRYFYKLAENYWFLLWIRSLFSPFVVDGNDVVVAAAVSAVALNCNLLRR